MKKIKLINKPIRAILSDTLPYELPLSFSNFKFFKFMLKYYNEQVYKNPCQQDKNKKDLTIIFSLLGISKENCEKNDIKLLNSKPLIYYIKYNNKLRELF